MLGQSARVREQVETEDFIPPSTLDQMARQVWGDIASDTGDRTQHAKRVARLYLMCRDIQHARSRGAGMQSLRGVVALLHFVTLNALRVAPVVR